MPLLLPAAEGKAVPPPYPASTGATFTLKLAKMSAEDAEACCNKLCAHLASYTGQDEQYEVGGGHCHDASVCPCGAPVVVL
jgi:hypothetical protein